MNLNKLEKDYKEVMQEGCGSSKKKNEQEEFEVFEEEVDAKEIIGELIDTGWSGDNEEQMKAVQLMKGLATSDDPVSNEFMKKIDEFTSGLDVSEFE